MQTEFLLWGLGGLALGGAAAFAWSWTKISILRAQLSAKDEVLAERQKGFDSQMERLDESFASLSQEALSKASENFLRLATQTLEVSKTANSGELKQRQQAIEELVKPLKESLEKLENQNQEIERKRLSAYDGITEHINRLMVETGQLNNALRRPHVRGAWGELTLRKAAENAGLVEGQDFTMQVTTEDGSLRPDMVVRLPNDRVIVVDCKTPLDSYLDAVQTADEEIKAVKLKAHAALVRKHVQQLSSKAYWTQFQDTPDFVVMFVPAESLYHAALEHDPELLDLAFRSRVVLANPMNLVALLRTVACAMEQEKLKENAQEICRVGSRLYDGLRSMAGHMTKVGRNLRKTTEAYNNAVGSMERNVLSKGRQLRALGAGNGDDLAVVEGVEVYPREFASLPLLVEGME